MLRRFRSLFRRERLDRDLSDEIEFHLEMVAEEKIRQGLSPEEARLAARREFGGVDQVKEAYRDARGFPAFESVLADCAHGLHVMRRNLSFTAAVVATLALGIGASTAVFTVGSTVLLRRLQVPDPDRTFVLLSTKPKDGTSFSVAEGVFVDWRERARSFDAIAGIVSTSPILSGAGLPHELNGVKVTAQFFSIAGLATLKGRIFDSAAEQFGRDDVVVLSHGFWDREFGRRPDILGARITLDDRPYTVIGVVSSGFALGGFRGTDVWMPLVPRRNARAGGPITVLAKLRSDISRDAARAEIEAVHEQVRRESPQDSGSGVEMKPLHEWVVGEARPALLALTGAVLLLLMICCVNTANLLLARATARQREFAIRTSLGGGRARIVRQIVTEILLLSGTGGLAGWLIAIALVRAIPNMTGFYLPRVEEIRPDGRMALIALAVTVVGGILVSLAPAWQEGWRNARPLLSSIVAGAATPGGMRLRRALVVAQVGLSLMLLCGAGLLLNSFIRLAAIDVGFSKDNVVAAGVVLPRKSDDTVRGALFQKWLMEQNARAARFHRRLMDELRAMPGVLDVSACDYLPLQTVHFAYLLAAARGAAAPFEAQARNVDPHYFRVLGIPILAGREFEPADETRVPVPVILNADAARRLFGSPGEALGKQITSQYRDRRALEVIGVAADVRQLQFKQEAGPQLYVPLKFGSAKNTIARVATNAGDLSAAIRAAVFRLDPSLPAPKVSNANTWFEGEFAKPRFYLILVGAFAAAGLALAAVGIYGVVAFSVARRTHEFGVRMALGACRGDILRSVLLGGAGLIAAGLLIGVLGGLAATTLLGGVLYNVRANDPATFAAACLVLAGIALLACYLAARRATQLEPIVALRYE